MFDLETLVHLQLPANSESVGGESLMCQSQKLLSITYLISLCFFIFRSVGCSINLYLLTRGGLTSLGSCKLLPPPIRFSWHQFGSWHRCDEIGCGRGGNLKILRYWRESQTCEKELCMYCALAVHRHINSFAYSILN